MTTKPAGDSAVKEAVSRNGDTPEILSATDHLRSLLDNVQANVFVADTNLTIVYMNDRAKQTMEKIEDEVVKAFGVKIDQILGGSIHRFHKDPQRVEKILHDPQSLPHEAQFSFGDITLKATIAGARDDDGELIAYVVSWDDVSDKVRAEREMARVMSMMENAPTNMMFVDTDLTLRYMNPASEETLRTLQDHLPVSVDEMIGTSIDVFHKDPAHQRRILGDPSNLPWTAQIQVGPEKLDLLVSAIYDNNGEHIGAMASWEVVTEKVRLENEMARVKSMMENAPTNMMFVDTDLTLRYMNPASEQTLRTLQDHLPVPVDEMIGTSIDVFHKNPAHQRKILADPSNLPWKAQIQVGPETLDLLVSAIYDNEGNHIGAMASWEVITEKLRLEREMARVQSMMENAPTNMMFVDTDLTLRYMNPASEQTLRTLQDHLPVSVDEMIGTSIDVFHKNPAHQRDILRDPSNLPWEAQIQVGPETLDLLVSAIYDNEGNHIGAMASWEVITEKLKMEEENRLAQERERQQAEELREKVDSMLEVVAAAAEGDLTREVTVAGEDAIGQMGEGLARLLEDLRVSIAAIGRNAQGLTESANDLSAVSTQLEANAKETSNQANSATEASKGVAANVEAVATASEEMSASIKEISQNTSHAAEVAGTAVQAADRTTETINKLGDSSAEIGKIIKVITDIAQQTNLLALNATIEAARAGESGKGFAVVANEVKELAKETARATEDISEKIETIQTDTKGAVDAIGEISEIINQISEIQTAIASAVEEQAATTSEIARSVNDANQGAAEITQNIEIVADAAQGTTQGANDTQRAATELTKTAAELNSLVEKFTY